MILLADFNVCLFLKSTFFINGEVLQTYIIVMLREGASFRWMNDDKAFKFRATYFHTNWLL